MIRFQFTRYELPELIDLHRYKVAAEVGVNLGQFSYHLLKYSKLSMLFSVDHYPGKYRTAKAGAQTLLGEFGERSKFVNVSSVAFAATIPPGFFDFVYIDAAHDRANAAADIEAWKPLVRSGGMLAGHDYTKHHAGVIEAVDEFAAQTGWPLYLTREAWSSWMFFVP